MVPKFNGGAYSPVTPNNGNPNTVYNTSPNNDQEVPYLPAFEQPLGGGEIMQPNYGMLQPGQTVKPEFGDRFAGPVVAEASGTAVPQVATPMPKPQLGGAVAPSFAKPMVPEGSAVVPNIKPRLPVANTPAGQAPANTVPLFNNPYSRSPLAITMEQPEQPSGRLDRNTMYTDALNGMLSRMQSLETTLQPIPIPGVSQPQPGGGGGTAPTGPTNPTQPERPRLPGIGTSTPDENGIVRGPDPIDYGRRAEVANGFGAGNFTGMGSLLGLQGRQTQMFQQRAASAYDALPPYERAAMDAYRATLNSPTAAPAEKESAWQQITAFGRRILDSLKEELGNAWEEMKDDVMNPGRAFRDPAFWMNAAVPGLGTIFDAIRNNGNFSDTRPMRPGQTGTVTVGNVGGRGGSSNNVVLPNITTTPNAPNHQAVRDTLNSLPNYNPNAPSGQGSGGASGAGGGGNTGGSVGGGTGAGGSSRITNPWDQKPGSRLPRRPT
jgi:uncharacterized membrane protein YgcG